eukprot:CAMPEP_0170519758 /NCGR_PEP_ID=MMETSP0209-20121228/5055_1 /TAXON_ID=665100 ORGANISM="Litonotus pictus, Strain P1" /NCGR_SAMPLE_ID=MMETSP0209 /ASSEMBLY_ACC=CAM_ASM_000301 /LENGTH=426 /DNA_ID=CAMNT_0010805717 /DNA_START=280 /DNA_END=1557 /DNA_ORIENTATION=+
MTSSMVKMEKSLFVLEPEENSNILATLSFLLSDSIAKPEEFSANAQILVLIELISFEQKGKSRYEMSLLEKIDYAQKRKAEGVELFKQKNFHEAFGVFEEGSAYLLTEAELTRPEDKELLISLLLNKANCLNQLGKYESALVSCEYILKRKKHPKAYYHKANALLNLPTEDNLIRAEEAIKKLAELISSNDPGVANLEALLSQKKGSMLNSQKNLYKNLFKNKNLYNEKPQAVKKEIPKEVNPYNPKVFFNIQIGDDENKDKKFERVEFELFADVVPKTAENFLLLSSTEKYKGCIFHRLIKDFMIQGGDYEKYNGTGGKSIYGQHFEDENFTYNHTQAGLLSMANSGPNKNGSQFFLTFKACGWLDGKHVVFGRVIKGLDFVMSLNGRETGTDDRPLQVIKIAECGRMEIGGEIVDESTGENKEE